MIMNNKEFLNHIQLDVLKEIANIGCGNAATALSRLLGKLIGMKVPSVSVMEFNEMMEFLGGPDQEVASVFLRFSGDLEGNMFFILPVEKAEAFVREMTGFERITFSHPSDQDLALSAFQEMGNILAGSCLTAMAEFLKISLLPSVPAVAIDMFGAIITYGLFEISRSYDFAIVIDTEISEPQSFEGNGPIRGHFLILPDPDSFDKIFSLLGVQNG